MNRQLVLVLAAGLAAALLLRKQSAQVYDDETIIDTIGQTMDEALGALAPGPVADMYASEELRVMLKNREKLRLERYNIGDGGWTIGYGHFEKDINKIPSRITFDEAESMFDRDLYERAEKWVRLYVQRELYQHEYDALVHIAYNLSPKSFKKFADTVNAGQGIDYWAQRSVTWVAPHLQNGIQARRDEEMALYNRGQYA